MTGDVGVSQLFTVPLIRPSFTYSHPSQSTRTHSSALSWMAGEGVCCGEVLGDGSASVHTPELKPFTPHTTWLCVCSDIGGCDPIYGTGSPSVADASFVSPSQPSP